MRSDSWCIVTMATLFFLDEVAASLSRVCTPFTKSFGPHPHGVCGNRIDELLSTFCIGGYNERPRRRRDVPEGDYKDMHSIFIRREDANSYLVKRSNFYERNIVCECCYHQCSVYELILYCRNGLSFFNLVKRSVPDNNQSYYNNYSND